jgi:integrase
LIVDAFSIEEVLRLLEAAREKDERDWLLLCMTFLHALRASEAVAVTPDSIVGEYLVVKRGKRSKPVRQLLVAHDNSLLNEKPALIELARKTLRNQKLFPISARTFQRKMHRYGELAGLPDLLSHPHTLKHSILSHLVETMSLREVQEISGHKSLGSLGIYLHPKAAQVQAKYRDALKI